MEQVVGTRKPALDNMPVACCNRRGFSAEKRVHFGPPLKTKKWVKFGPPHKKSERSGGLAQLGERLPCKQEVSGSIPLISTTFKRLTEIAVKAEISLSLLKGLCDAPWKLNIVIMMQLWEGNSKG